MRLTRIAKLVGILTIVVGFSMALPLLVALYYSEWVTVRSFLISIAFTVAAGFAMTTYGRGQLGTVFRREALLVVGVSWVITGLFGAMPFFLESLASDAITSFDNPVDALFESISGFTTTGSTVLTGNEFALVSKGLHFWRCFTHWLGGIGIVVIFVAVFPQLGVGGKVLFKSEVAGPITEGLKPKIRETGRTLFRIYLTLTLLCMVALMAAGLPVFEAACHAVSTLGTGGFSTEASSVAGFNSAAVDCVLTVFMILAGINFGLYFMVVRGGTKRAIRDRELWVYLALLAIVTVVMAINIHGFDTPSKPEDASIFSDLRYASFQVASIVSTTGFCTDDFNLYPNLSRMLFFALFFMGGMAGSTAGGLKTIRAMVLFKAARGQLVRTFRPQAVTAVKLGRRMIPADTVKEIHRHFLVYILLFVLGSLVMATMTDDLETTLSVVIASLGNVGPGLGGVGAVENYAWFPAHGKLFLSGLMILGRLEMFTILVLFIPSFWRR